jgi:antitoxin (DNA-binding transcriptional repressor) of toxin-antitoxin stability system
MGDAATPLPVHRHEVPMAEARLRLSQLARQCQHGDMVTYLVDAGSPVAAVVPAAAARTVRQMQASAMHSEAAAAGWAARVEQVRSDVRRQHQAQSEAVREALAQAWELLDLRCPPGTDRAVDALRALHRQHLSRFQ